MTEGIIQKIISKERKDLKEFKHEFYDTQERGLCDVFDRYLLNIEQELIEEINRLKPKYYSELLEKYHPIIVELIGDNE